MISFSRSLFCRTAAVFLASLLIFQSAFLLAQSGDALVDRLIAARLAYLAGDYASAQGTLTALLDELEKAAGRETMMGEAHLLLGAALEKLLDKAGAVDHYCLAKALLGVGRSSEGIDLNALQFYPEPCPPVSPPPVVQAVAVEDPLEAQFSVAKAAFFDEDYPQARAVLEKLIAVIAEVEGRDTMKGEIYLLSGAVYEKLKYKELAVKYFCLAKEILGKGKTFPGLILKDYKQYKADCAAREGTARMIKKKGGFGRFLTGLFGLAILVIGGYLLYTKVIKKDKEGDENETIYYETEYQAWNCWHASASSSSTTLPTISPASDWAPKPVFSNNYDDQRTVSITGPQIYFWEIKLAITACKGLTRRDIVYVNDSLVLDVTDKFDQACGGTISDFCANPLAQGKETLIVSGSGEATLKLRHRIIFTLPSGAQVSVVNNSTFRSK